MVTLKNIARRLAAPFAFCFAVAILLVTANAVLSPKSETMSAFYAEPDNTIDVLFVGGSHAAAAFDPIQLWEEQGFTSYTLYSWGQPAWTSYHYVKEALKTQQPRVVVVEGFGFMYGSSYLSDANFNDVSDDFSLMMRPSLNRAQLAMAMSRWQTGHRPVWQYTSLLRYHGRWKALTPSDFTWFLQDHYSTGKGFGPIYTREAFSGQLVAETAQQGNLYPGCEEYLYRLIELSQKEGFQLVIAAAPYIVEQPEEWGAWQRIADICAQNNVAFINYNGNDAGQQAGFDYATDMAEHAHVNLYGAEKLTRHIGQYLAKNASLPDHRQDTSYQYWQQAVAIESWDREKMRLRLSATAAEYLPRLKTGGFTAFIVSRGNISGPGSEPIAEGLHALGIDVQFMQQSNNAGLIAVTENGTVTHQQTTNEPLQVTAAGLDTTLSAGENASITINGEQLTLAYENSLCVVVVETASGDIVQSVVFSPSEGCITRTD